MTEAQKKAATEFAQEVQKLQDLLTKAGVKSSTKVLGKTPKTIEIPEGLEPQIREWKNDAGQEGKLYIFAYAGVSGLWTSETMPAGVYGMVATQNEKNKEKGGLSWVRIS